MYQLFIQALLLSLFLCSICISVMAMQKSSNNQKILLVASVCAFISCFGYYYELKSVSMDAILVCIKIGYIGKVFAIFLFTTFVKNYANIHMPRWVTRSLYLFYVVILYSILTCQHHKLYYSSIELIKRDEHVVVDLGKGPLYYVYTISLVFIMVFLMVVSIKNVLTQKGDFRKIYISISFTGILPMMGFLCCLSGISDGYDPTPVALALANVLITFAVVRYGLIDTVLMAKELIVEGTNEAVIIYSLNKEILYMNSVAESLMEKNFRGINVFDERNHVLEIDGKSYEIRISEVQDAGKIRGYIAWFFDITEITRKNRELVLLTEQAERANQAKSTFLSNMSHEIRTPMNAILGFSQLILNHDIEPEVKEYMDDIVSASHSLLAVINDILDISRIETGKMEIVPTKYYISSIMKDMNILFSQQAKQKGLEYFMDIDETLPSQMYGDKIRIRGILINLINNAIKYTQNGEVRLTVKVVERFEHKVRIQCSIKDTGIGIRDEDQIKLFDAFAQFDREMNYGIEGSGLGLSIASGLIKLMGGTIRVESEYGVGSNFIIEIEQEVIDATPMDMSFVEIEQDENTKKFTFPGMRVLAVDDNEINLRVVSGILQSYEIEVDAVSSGKEAIEACGKLKYDMILMDQMMPELNGTQTMKLLRETYKEYKSCPIIALTADAMSGVKERLMKEGFDEYLCKPLSTKSLERILSEAFSDKLVVKQTESSESKEKIRKGDSNTKEEKEDMETVFGEEFCKLVQVEKGIANCGGKQSDYFEILKITLEYGVSRIKELVLLKEQGDYENYTIKVHSLKSTAANIGAMEVSAMAFEQEMAGKEGRYEVIDENMDALIQKYQAVLDLIQSLLEERGFMQPKREQGHVTVQEQNEMEFEISEDDFQAILNDVFGFIEDFEFDSIESMLDSLKTYRMRSEHMEVIEKLSEYIQELQVDEMKELILKWKE
ncbi:MAG: response regulator [Lachnospiraceae bacterium]|nr:response regulator [Lachnospiraceae bacterium]